MKENYLKESFEINQETIKYLDEIALEYKEKFLQLEEIAEFHQYRVIKAMQNKKLSDMHFNVATGYGYNDLGRDILEEIYASIFNTDDALVRPHISSGTHAISLCLYGILRPGDQLLSITGGPYDTIKTLIGHGDANISNDGTLRDFGIEYKEVSLNSDGSFAEEKIFNSISKNTKMIYIQRSKGYEWRKALTIEDIGNISRKIKEKYPHMTIFVDNCYGEFMDIKEPTDVGVDLMAGSLIKNPGGGLAPTGGYVVGKKNLVYKAACRLSAPGVAKETGATLGINRTLLMGLFLAPTVVMQAVKTAILLSAVYEKMGFKVCPKADEYRNDIIQGIKFETPEGVMTFCKAVQEAAPVDSFVTPIPWDMPGYDCQVIMAAGAFIQGSSIELSADAPMRAPYTAYFQGGLTHFHGKLGILLTIERLKKAGIINNWRKNDY